MSTTRKAARTAVYTEISGTLTIDSQTVVFYDHLPDTEDPVRPLAVFVTSSGSNPTEFLVDVNVQSWIVDAMSTASDRLDDLIDAVESRLVFPRSQWNVQYGNTELLTASVSVSVPREDF